MQKEKLLSIIMEDAGRVCGNVDFFQLAGKTVMVTGASGLIGLNLLASLRQYLKDSPKGTKVIAIARQTSEYLNMLTDYEGAQIICGDLSQAEFFKELPQADFIIHAAGYAQPGKFLSDPVKTLKLNTLSTYFLFDRLRAGGKFLFISSSEIYSGLPNPPYKENQIGTTNTDHPRVCYIEGKRCGEAICRAYREKQVEAKAARVSLVYGPGSRPGDVRALHSFIDSALKNHEINLMDTGAALRTYCYSSDIITMLWQVLLFGKEAVYNVGGRSEISILELAKKIGANLGAKVNVPKENKGLAGAPLNVSVDVSKLEGEFGKKDFASLDVGLERTILWQQALL